MNHENSLSAAVIYCLGALLIRSTLLAIHLGVFQPSRTVTGVLILPFPFVGADDAEKEDWGAADMPKRGPLCLVSSLGHLEPSKLLIQGFDELQRQCVCNSGLRFEMSPTIR